MEFTRLISVSVVLAALILGSFCLEIKIQESDGVADDGFIEAGSTFSIYCDVPEIKAGNLAVWFKRQGDSLPSVLGFNDFLLDPSAQAKFTGTSLMTGPEEGEALYAYVLNLSEDVGADFQDSGEYGCALTKKMPQAADHEQLDIQYASLVVIDPVDDMRLFSVRKDQVNDPLANFEEHVDGDSVVVSNDEERYFRCVARGSNPPSTVNIVFNERDITEEYKEETQKNFVEEEETTSSSHHITHDVIMTSLYPTKITREDNEKLLVCSAGLPDRDAEQIAIQLKVEGFAPKVECKDTLAEYQQRIAQIKCHVHSDSDLNMAQFVYHEPTANGYINHTIQLGEKVGPMTVKRVPGKYDNEWVYVLEFEYVPEQSFRSYTFQTSNAVSKDEAVSSTAALMLDNPGAVMADSASDLRPMVLPVLALLSILAAFVKL